jgi:iron complex transport system substrate-binding protein
LLSLLVGCSAPSGAAGGAPPRVASTNLCADLVLLAVAAPEQIVSVSRQAQDPRSSPVAAVAQRFPGNRGSVEEMLYLEPEVVLAYQGWTGRRHGELLARRGIRVVPLPYPEGWDEALRGLRETAAAIGRAEQAREVTAEAARRMRALAEDRRPYSVLYLRPSGGSAGSDTYLDDLLGRLGLRNFAADHGHTGWGRFPLELLIDETPDLFLLGYFDQGQPLTQSRYARHPLLRSLLRHAPTIALPSNGWGCGGLELLDAAEHVAAGIDRLEAERRLPRLRDHASAPVAATGAGDMDRAP